MATKTKYFKGYDITFNRRIVIALYYEALNEQELDVPCMIEVTRLDDTAIDRLSTIEECTERGYKFDREISEEEYNLYILLAKIITECFLNQYVGGFPSRKLLSKSIGRYQKTINELLTVLDK